MENLSLKHIEQECTADPLFRKMCAQFDELGGMAGMLQSSLPLSTADFSLIFDEYQLSLQSEIKNANSISPDMVLTAIGNPFT